MTTRRPMKPRTATFIGAPLDGQQITNRSGRWSIYRDDHGNPIPAARGDREFCNPTGRPARRHYAHQLSMHDGGHVYVHATVIDEWCNQGATTS